LIIVMKFWIQYPYLWQLYIIPKILESIQKYIYIYIYIYKQNDLLIISHPIIISTEYNNVISNWLILLSVRY
ncbi:MAG: hypothetical protein N7Q72_05945, partial [Spiroplasma sp. Tabriz.8]|nr:hypothetical protein [Spiroplasma sp. Tabriz.8]